jgi:uncharacterized protein (TIRG00374 family)
MNDALSKTLKLAAKVLVTAALFYYVLHQVDMASFKDALREVDLVDCAMALLVTLLLLYMPAIAQDVLFKPMGIKVSAARIYLINLISMFYSLVVPGDVAAGLSRLYNFTKANTGTRQAGAAPSIFVGMAVDRLLNMGALILPVPFLLYFFPILKGNDLLMRVSVLSVAAYLIILGFFYLFPFGRLMPSSTRKAVAWLRKTVLAFADLFQSIPLRALFSSFSWTFVYQVLCMVVVERLLFDSVGVELRFTEVLSVVCIVRFLRLIPVTLSGLGIREGLYPFFLAQYGVGHEKALLLGLLGSFLMIVLGLIGGIIELGWIKKKTVHVK